MSNTDDRSRYVVPEKLDTPTLTPAQVAQWKEEGYCLVDGLLDEAAVAAVAERTREAVGDKSMEATFGSGGRLEFPTTYKELNEMTINETVIAAVQQLLGRDVVLSQSDVWVKRSGTTGSDYDHSDQRIHMDFPNHTLVHPPEWGAPETVAIIIYYSNASETGGRTAVLPRMGPEDPNYEWPYANMPGYGPVPWKNDKAAVETMLAEDFPDKANFRKELYKQEKYVDFKEGTVLFYRHDIWHRGTPMLAGKERIVQNLVFKQPDCPWVNQWNSGTARQMYMSDQLVEKMVATSSLAQRSVLGFPPPGHRYWTPKMVEAARMRYEHLGMDMTPYSE
eukprot:TRINITY_DN13720_c0_g1_i2.p1 TRINITY_DN13720_c0_g1~~TRINITY_DN13720_c0_g1_i2.p1  ORF type:complete len:335 (+),score=75.84 TRINITY_DN13720_c0_g1_i2:31-1035(+)